MKPNLNSVVALFFVAAVAVVLLSAFLALRASESLRESEEWVSHTNAVIADLETIESAVGEAESDYRGYAITGQESFLRQREATQLDAETALDRLVAEVSDNPTQESAAVELRSMVHGRLQLISEAIDVRRDGGLQAVIPRVGSGEGARMTAEIRKQVLTMEIRERSLLTERQERVNSASRRTHQSILFGSVPAVVLLTIAGLLLQSDIRRRVRAERELRAALDLQQAIMQSAGDGLFGLDTSFRVTFINPAGAAMLGFTEEELRRSNIHELSHHTRADGRPHPMAECPVYASLHTAQLTRVTDDIFWRKDGSSFPVEFVASPVKAEGCVVGVVVTFRDVTERRAIEKMKDEFISVVSHELRTPLTSIRGSLGLLASGSVGAVPPSASRMLDIAVNNSDRLIRLVNDILDVERIHSGKLELLKRRTALAELVAEAIANLLPVAEAANVHMLSGVNNEYVEVDPDRIVQVLINLMGNAIKFSPNGGQVEVTSRKRDGHVVIEVRDHGRGIPRAQQGRIFDRFHQVTDTDAREKGGAGLGLSIAQNLVAMHSGRLWVESEEGKGSSFFFSLPLAQGTGKRGPA